MSQLPPFQGTMNPLLEVLRESTSPLSIDELDRRVEQRMGLSPEVLAIPHDPEKPDRSEVAYRIAWARTWLKKAGLVDNPRRGEWTVTPEGRTAGKVDVDALVAAQARAYRIGVEHKSGDAAEEQDPAIAATADEQRELDTSDDEASAARVGPVLQKQLRELAEKLRADGELPDQQQVASMVQRFRERFSPEALAGLDGLPLLTRMHGRGAKDSLVHWLEFKEDDEFSTGLFGSIAGGSALKFGLYQNIDTGAWMAGPPLQQVRLEIDDAIGRARAQRDELLAANRVLLTMAAPGAPEYATLQEDVVSAAPTVADSAWGHKVLSLWFPHLLDPFHVQQYQEHHLRCLLKLAVKGRYANAGTFAGIAKQLRVTLLELGKLLAWRNGGPYSTWRIGTNIDGASHWEAMRAGSYLAVGWRSLGDLSNVPSGKGGKEVLKTLLQQHYASTPSNTSRSANQLYNFVQGAEERDVVVAMDGVKVLGVGRIAGPYEFAADDDGAHRRRCNWELVDQSWQLPQTEGLQTTFVQLQKFPQNLIEVEARLLAGRAHLPPRGALGPPPAVVTELAPKATGVAPPAPPPPALLGVIGRIGAVLARKRQVILYGPPGTGKTHWATVAARELVARSWFGREDAAVTPQERAQLEASRAIELVSFHPGYGYEDFLEGYRPAPGGSFELREGVFVRLCERAKSDPSRQYLLLIDEINRGDLPRIFGELLTVIERDKRGKYVTLPLSGKSFMVPDNVYLIGTMNTADRSIALLDAALRRRFGFIELLPDTTLFKGVKIGKIPLEAWLDALNDKILEHAGRDARNLRIGHAYFLHSGAPIQELSRFAELLRDDIIPLLEEVCYEDFEALERILGPRIVQRAKKRIDVDLFEPHRYDALQDAILQAFPTLVTTKAAADADAVAADDAADEAAAFDDVEAGDGD